MIQGEAKAGSFKTTHTQAKQNCPVSYVSNSSFAWFIGWSLYWIGYKEKVVKPKKISVTEETTITVTIPEMEYAIQLRADT